MLYILFLSFNLELHFVGRTISTVVQPKSAIVHHTSSMVIAYAMSPAKIMCWWFFQLEVNIVSFISRVLHHLILLRLNVIKMILIYLLYKWLFDRYTGFFKEGRFSSHCGRLFLPKCIIIVLYLMNKSNI